ncbi:MAG: hypothetical protein IKY83_03475 [Proteobacteria bacterium]|nr:hypothetical protein [Pseudomonadota bacterium]
MRRGYVMSVAAAAWMFGAWMTACGDDHGETGKPAGCASGSEMCGDACCSDTCVDGACIDLNTDPKNCGKAGTVCGADESCVDGVCKGNAEPCVSPKVLCDSECVDTASDVMHCGTCGNACLGSEACEAGVCVIRCAEGLTRLTDGTCVDMQTDSSHCGSEGNACGDQMYCNAGACECVANHYDCDKDPANGCESILICKEGCTESQTACGDACCDAGTVCCGNSCMDASDPRHCGGCETICRLDQTCEQGACVDVPEGFACDTAEKPDACWGVCVNLASDDENCGSCGDVCGDDAQCKEGVCQSQKTSKCGEDEIECYGICRAVLEDNDNCGACLNACGANEKCVQGSCEIQCGAQTRCGQKCVDIASDVGNCGGCGVVCKPGEQCVAGECGCAEGRYDCDGDASNGCEATSLCPCTPGAEQACWRGSETNLDPLTKQPYGECRLGTQKCDPSGNFWGPCEGGVYPTSVSCNQYGDLNGKDNDCDGKIDTVCRSECELKAGEMSYIGCEYWSVYLYNLITTNHTLVFSNPSDTDTATIYIYDKNRNANASQQPVHTLQLEPKKVLVQQMNTGSTNMCVSTSYIQNAYRIRSTSPITAYQFNPWDKATANSNDASLLLPANVLGRDYIGMTWHSETGSGSQVNDHTSYLTVVATEPGQTKVKIKTTANIVKGSSIAAMKSGEEREFTLDRYGVLTLNAPNVETEEQTGTRITADKNIAVFGGSRSSYVPNAAKSGCCRDHIEEQLFPTQAWGKAYYAVAAYSKGKAGDFWRIIARDDNTKVTISGSPTIADTSFTLKAGEAYPVFESRGGFVVTADKPISLGQFLPSKGYNNPTDNIGDPSFILTVPYEQYREDYAFQVPNSYSQNYITIISPAETKVSLDGKVLQAANYVNGKTEKIGSTGFVYGYVSVSVGVHRIEADKPVGVYGYGYQNISSYGYPVGLDLKVLNTN